MSKEEWVSAQENFEGIELIDEIENKISELPIEMKDLATHLQLEIARFRDTIAEEYISNKIDWIMSRFEEDWE